MNLVRMELWVLKWVAVMNYLAVVRDENFELYLRKCEGLDFLMSG